jgi:hypothetical protein
LETESAAAADSGYQGIVSKFPCNRAWNLTRESPYLEQANYTFFLLLFLGLIVCNEDESVCCLKSNLFFLNLMKMTEIENFRNPMNQFQNWIISPIK